MPSRRANCLSRYPQSYVRRALLLGTSAGWLLAEPAVSQRAPKLIGVLSPYPASDSAPRLEVFKASMRELGYREGTHYVIAERTAEGHNERLQTLAEGLVRLKPDVIITSSTNGARAVQRASSTIPVVFFDVSNPVRAGFAMSLARPGGNMTGISNYAGLLVEKRYQLLMQIVPGLSRVAVLTNPTNPYGSAVSPQYLEPARALGLNVFFVDAAAEADVSAAFDEIKQREAQAVSVVGDTYLWTWRRTIVDLALSHRMPLMAPYSDFVEAGGLLSYGVDRSLGPRRAASYVDKVLKGTKAGELPIEEPTDIELFINRKTAAKLNLSIPTALAVQATIIE